MSDKSRRWTDTQSSQMDGLLDRYELEWRNGDIQSLGEAVALCGWNSYPLPEWCVDTVLDALELYSSHGGRGRAQSPAGKLATKQAHKQRHELVKFYLKFPRADGKKRTLEQVCEEVATILKAQCISARTVLASYRRVEKETRKPPI